MGPEERLEALRDDARWQPVRLYPEHGRMPAPVRAQPWRVVIGAAVVIAAVAVVFGGISAFRGFGNEAAPAPLHAGGPVVTRSPTATPGIPSAELLAKAKLPAGAVAGTVDTPPLPIAGDGSVCGMVSTDARFWTIKGMDVAGALAWLTDNQPSGMETGAGIWQMGSDDVVKSGYVLDAVSSSATQGLLFTVAAIQDYGVAMRVDALDLPQGDECVADALRQSYVPAAEGGALENPATQAERQAAERAAELAQQGTGSH
jgi:hypothetical protein